MTVFIILCCVGYTLNFCTPKCVLDNFCAPSVPISWSVILKYSTLYSFGYSTALFLLSEFMLPAIF